MSSPAGPVLASRQSLAALTAMGVHLAEEEWTSPTDCPRWTVGDVYARVISGEQWVADGAPALHGDAQAWVDRGVEQWRGAPRERVLDELRRVVELRERQLAEGVPAPDASAWWPWTAKSIPFERLLTARAFDLWVHEQDVRRAVSQPGNVDSPGARLALEMILWALPRTVAKTVRAPGGSVVRITVVGELPADVAVQVDGEGRGSLVPPDAFPATAHATLSWAALRLLGTGRGRPPECHAELSGDRGLAQRVLDNLNIAM